MGILFLLIGHLLVISVKLLQFQVDAKIVGAYVVPHGSLALDPSHFQNATTKPLAEAIHESLQRASQDVGDQNPELIFLSTPHGVADLDKFLIYINTWASGVTLADSCTNVTECAYKLKVTLAANTSMNLVQHLRRSHAVSGISGFGQPTGDLPANGTTDGTVPFPLAWGEIIPLYFIPHLARTKVIILSHPTRRYSGAASMIPELLHLGRSIYLRLEHLPERVTVIISADLAHTHDPNGPYGFSPAAQPFDDAIGRYLNNTLEAGDLLHTAGDLDKDALSCGYTGLVMLHGMLSEGGLKKWSSKLLINGHPTYYGMAVAVMKRHET